MKEEKERGRESERKKERDGEKKKSWMDALHMVHLDSSFDERTFSLSLSFSPSSLTSFLLSHTLFLPLKSSKPSEPSLTNSFSLTISSLHFFSILHKIFLLHLLFFSFSFFSLSLSFLTFILLSSSSI